MITQTSIANGRRLSDMKLRDALAHPLKFLLGPSLRTCLAGEYMCVLRVPWKAGSVQGRILDVHLGHDFNFATPDPDLTPPLS